MPRSGLRERFERLALPLQDEIYRGALSLVGTEADALDLVQETYLRAYRAFGSYREEQRFKAWLFTILRNAHVDFRRRRNLASPGVDPEGLPEPSSPFAPADPALPPDLQNALDSMNPFHRSLLLLREVHGFTYREIADLLDRPVGSIMSGLHHARKKLREMLNERQGRAAP